MNTIEVELITGPDCGRKMRMPFKAGRNLVEKGFAKELTEDGPVATAQKMDEATKNKAAPGHDNKSDAPSKTKKRRRKSRS